LPQNKTVDVIVSNPPYIPTNDMLQLAKNVYNYEPHNALDGGIDGLDFYRKISAQALKRLNPKGLIAFEIGYNQGEAMRCILTQNGYTDIQIQNDLAGLDRVVTAQMVSKEA
jgi:release factor glutamine methyltransferase